ncbi:unnamed protein product [Nippostrongylus brasiliensis]|uniref:DNA mismatch repair protein Msh6 (inferred by orthology to a human protein) n=1 Tax=Nippostrongylus brasiliensis TaxID=27835 RepID=A0A0N4YF17_NIPBR|nr:unnamed protein product [Nippostrongylus brasiliensis]
MSSKKQSSLFSFFTPKAGQSTPSSSTPKSVVATKSVKFERDGDGAAEDESRTLKRVNDDNDVSPIRRTNSVKRRRIIVSSDEEDEGENVLEVRTPPSSLQNASTASIDTLDRTIYQVEEKERKYKDKEDIAEMESEKFTHETLPFLKPEKIRDAQGRRPDDEDYDPTTLFVPADFLKEQTPGHRQWWTIKSKNYDVVLLFKVGKFYELYHMDAVIAVECLSLTFMRGSYAHCGFPEAAYGKFADQLVSRGYKVARIEQTETPQQLEERNSRAQGGKDKVVRREVCRVTTSGTRTYSVIDGCNTYGGEADTGEAQSKYLLSIKECVYDQTSTYGVCLVDTSVGKFHIGEFRDDDYNSYLRTLIANFTPVQVLHERGNLSPQCKVILSGVLSSVQKEALSSKKQFLDADETLKLALRGMLDPDSVIPKPGLNSALALSALGAVLYYLQRCLIDVDMITMREFALLEPVNNCTNGKASEKFWESRQMVLDGITLQNLNLVPGDNNDAQAASLSLYSTMNKCQTAFGKRLLRQWICSPTCDLEVIRERQDAIQYLIDPARTRFVEKAGELLRKLPDLERLLQKIHTMGLKYRAETHPDSRAVMFEAANYNKRKIKDLLNTLEGFGTCQSLIELYDSMTQGGNGVAEKEGMIVPQKGQDEEYDDACRGVNEATHNLETYRKEQEEKLRCKITFFGSGKNRFQMEIPENVGVPRYYERKIWSDVLNRVAEVDVLLSLARYCQTCGLALCRPQFEVDTEERSDELLKKSTISANDSHLGGTHAKTVLLTGPNMGGKSTLMRQVAVLTVMAHMGSLVPAESMRLSPVDRIFTRIGANDRLICGQSTFFVELSETLVILKNATKHSLVLIDELGRGTSTFDGTAIASAVLSDVSRRLQCRSFFSTHYHSLCKTASVNPNIALAHMACMVENENEDNPTEECVTFLYRLTDGVCPKSYGFFAARLAGVRPEVVTEAYEASRVIFDSLNRKKMAIASIKEVARGGGSVEQLREMIAAL